jgi:hypothetical protein
MLFKIVNWDNNGDNLCFQMVQELMAQQNEILRQLLQRQPHPQQYGGGQPQ